MFVPYSKCTSVWSPGVTVPLSVAPLAVTPVAAVVAIADTGHSSTAPASHPVPTGRVTPRASFAWHCAPDDGTRSRAGLAAPISIVWTGPL